MTPMWMSATEERTRDPSPKPEVKTTANAESAPRMDFGRTVDEDE
jgi:hypothetical protein